MTKTTISYEDKFKQLQHQLLSAYETYYVWKTLQREEYNAVYKLNNGFWSAVLPALQHEWFMGLARIFECSSYSKSGKIISVHSLIETHPNATRAQKATDFLDTNSTVLFNIDRIRDLRYAHNNASYLTNTKVFGSRFEIKYTEIEEVFEFTDKMLGILHPEEDNGYSLDHLKKEAEFHTKDVLTGLKYFNEKRTEYRNNWQANLQQQYEFPPKN